LSLDYKLTLRWLQNESADLVEVACEKQCSHKIPIHMHIGAGEQQKLGASRIMQKPPRGSRAGFLASRFPVSRLSSRPWLDKTQLRPRDKAYVDGFWLLASGCGICPKPG